jgi:nitrogen regulatory protein PII
LETDVQTHQRKRIDILVDAPLARKVAKKLEAAGAAGYSVFEAVGGKGRGGSWWQGEVSGAETKMNIMVITTEEKADQILTALAPLLDSHGLILLLSTVDVIRAERY